MPLTDEEKDDLYMTVSIEMVRMFDVLTHLTMTRYGKDELKFINQIEQDIRNGWPEFRLPD